jgi:PhnB protein
MKLNAHLSFKGQCEEAFRFYEKCLGGKIAVMMTWGESPMAKDVPPDWAKKITHASMTMGDQELTGGDSLGKHYEKPQGFSVAIHLRDSEEADRIFKDLSDRGKVTIPLHETFWATRFGMVTDRFGTPWMINCGKGTAF